MPLISLRDISLSFGNAPILDKVNLHIDENERICILGRNGMGKSTMLKILQGDIQPDSGMVQRHPQLISARLTQDVPENITGTVYDVITAGLGDAGKLLANYQHLTHQIALTPTDALLEELQVIQHQLDQHHAWDLSHKIQNTITHLNLPADINFADLSGGLKRRVMLGQALVRGPEVLLLDEPTNHLDIESINWLETFLKEFKGSVVFITHDRCFLQNLATRIVELDRGQLRNYPGNYQAYQERKQHELEVEQIHFQQFDKKLAQEEIWIRQGIKARRTRNEGRVRELEKLRQLRQERRDVMGTVSMQTQQAEASGKLVLEAKNIHYEYDGKCLIQQFSTKIIRGDKIGIIGPNGSGKSTLIKILLCQLAPLSGNVRHGTKLEIAYFDQLREQLDEDKTVADNVSYGDQYVKINGRQTHIMSYLQDFLFSPEMARSPVSALSGGERNRLLLARLFSKPSNVLVMDEPTNDLDIETLELLEELLINYDGTILLVSHDRRFLDNIVSSTIVFEGQGIVNEYVGGYADWLRQRTTQAATVQPITVAVSPPPAAAKAGKQDYVQQKEVRALEQKIEKLEAQQVKLQEKLADPALYEAHQAQQLGKLQQELQTVEQELAQSYRRWETLM